MDVNEVAVTKSCSRSVTKLRTISSIRWISTLYSLPTQTYS